MSDYDSSLQVSRRSIVWLLAVSLLVFTAMALILVYVTPSQAAAAPSVPQTPTQAELSVGMEGPDQAPVMVQDFSGWTNNTLVYTIVITNSTGVVAHNVVITDQWNNTQPLSQWILHPLPVITETSYTADPGLIQSYTQTVLIIGEEDLIYETGRAVWELKDLDPGETGTIVFKMWVPSLYQPKYASRIRDAVGPTQLGHSVEITGTDDSGNPLETSPLDYVFTLIQGPVLDLVKTHTETPGVGPRPGWPITYTVEVYNMTAAEGREDSIPASGIVVWDDFPTELAYDGFCTTSVPGSSCMQANHTVTWELPSNYTLGLGESFWVTFTTRLSPIQEPDERIRNDDEALWADTNQTPNPFHAAEHYTFITWSIFHKEVEAPNPPPNTSQYIQAFPNQKVDYTVWVFNPLSQSVISGMTITDFLPPEWSFITQTGEYKPEIVGTPTETIEFINIDLEPSGIVSFSFEALIGPAADVQPGTRCGDTYNNRLRATWPGMSAEADHDYDWKFSRERPTPGQVKLVPQIELNKTVRPGGTQYPGNLVTYTIEIENVGVTDIHNLVISDSLPNSYFDYISTIDLQEPFTTTPQIAWEVGTVEAGETIEFSFVVRVDGGSGKWYNRISGRSPETTLCWYNREAPVTLVFPFNIDKTVSPIFPNPIVQDEWFLYTVEVENFSPSVAYTITRFADWLKYGGLEGVEAGGQLGYYSHTVEPPVLLPPMSAPLNWRHTFTPTLVGDGTGGPWCENMDDPEYRTPWQEGYSIFGGCAVWIYTLDPEGNQWIVCNGQDLARTRLAPHVSLEQYLYPHKVAMGKNLTVTLVMTNNMRNLRGGTAKAVEGIDLTYTLPDINNPRCDETAFEYLGAAPGYPQPDEVTDSALTWQNILLPEGPGTKETFVFRLRAPLCDQSRLDSIARGNPTLDPEICIPPAGAEESPLPDYLSVVKGIEVVKTPDKQLVGPRQGVEFELKLSNKTSLSLDDVVFTDTLPQDFIFDYMITGPDPQVDGRYLVWTLDFDPDGGSNDDQTLIYKTLAPKQVGDYVNLVSTGTHPSALAFYKECDPGDWPDEYPCFDYEEKVLVHVGAGVGLYKTVTPTQVFAGDEVVYTLVVHNLLFGKNLHNIIVTDTLPTGFTYLETLEGPEPEVNGQKLRFELGSLGAGNKQEFIFRAQVDEELFEGTYYNRAEGEALDPNNDPIILPDTDDTAPVRVISGNRPVQMDKTVWPNEVDAGNIVTYTINLANDQDQAQTLNLVDTLPTYFEFVRAVGDTAEPDSTSPIVWNGLIIPANTTQTLSFEAEIDPLTPSGTYWNNLSGEVDGFQLPDVDTAPVDVEGILLYDLEISKSDGVLLAFEGEALTYTIRYTFNHPIGQEFALYDVVLTETVEPADFTTGVTQPDGWRYVESLGVYTYDLGTLHTHYTGKRTGELTFTVYLSDVIPAEYERLTNTIQSDHWVAVEAYEQDLEDNQATDIDILRGSDLAITDITFDPAVPRVGQVITANITFVNQGKDDIETRWNGSGTGDDWLFVLEFYLKHYSLPPEDVFDHAGGYCVDPSCTVTRAHHLAWWPGLNNGESRTVPVTFTVEEEGNYYPYAQIDVSWPEEKAPRPGTEIGWGQPFGLVEEAIESNNLYTHGRISVEEPCVPLTGVGFAWTPQNPQTGEHALFTASFTPPDASQPITYEWDFGDGYTGGGNPVYHTFLQPGDFDVVLKASNRCGEAEHSQSLTVSGDPITDPNYGVTLQTENGTKIDAKQAPPGEDVRYFLTVSNLSTNVADSFDLALNSQPLWPTEIQPNVINLLPETSGQVTVTISVPYEVNLGEKDIIIVEATSRGDPEESDFVKLTTTAQAPQWLNPVYLPIVIKGD